VKAPSLPLLRCREGLRERKHRPLVGTAIGIWEEQKPKKESKEQCHQDVNV